MVSELRESLIKEGEGEEEEDEQCGKFSLKRDCLRLFVVVYKLVMLMLCCW